MTKPIYPKAGVGMLEQVLATRDRKSRRLKTVERQALIDGRKKAQAKRWREAKAKRDQATGSRSWAKPVVGLPLAQRAILAMLPGEWLTSPDIAARMGVPHRTIKPITAQRLRNNGWVMWARLEGARSTTAHFEGGSSPQTVYSLTLLGCAVRAWVVEREKIAGNSLPENVPDPIAKIPKSLLDSFGIDFSPFGRSGPAARRALRDALRQAWADAPADVLASAREHAPHAADRGVPEPPAKTPKPAKIGRDTPRALPPLRRRSKTRQRSPNGQEEA